jgi:hypothetical protein
LASSPHRSVRDEWLARLPEETDALFRASEAHFEACYGMLSVTLDEALSLGQQGELSRARAEVAICSALYENLAARLLKALEALESHTRHYGTQPAVAPLEPGYFRGWASRRSSTWNSLLHLVLFGSRLRWFHKLLTLQEIIADLAMEFRAAAQELSEGTAIDPGGRWASLEAMHDDLNTCLREMVVMLKCFLRALPAEQVKPFRGRFDHATDAQHPGTASPDPAGQLLGTRAAASHPRCGDPGLPAARYPTRNMSTTWRRERASHWLDAS